MKAQVTSFIFRSEGADVFGVLSIASSRPWPKVDSEANGVTAAARAALLKKFLLDDITCIPTVSACVISIENAFPPLTFRYLKDLMTTGS